MIHGGKVVGLWDAYDDALQAGYETCGLNPFMVKRVEAIERVQHFTRQI